MFPEFRPCEGRDPHHIGSRRKGTLLLAARPEFG